MRELLDLLEASENVTLALSFSQREQGLFVTAYKGDRQSRFMITKEMLDDDPCYLVTFAERVIRKVS